MTIREAQDKVDQWIKTYGVRYFNELTNMVVLTEEVGELARIMARNMGNNPSRKARNKTPARKWQTSCGYLSVWPIRRA